MRKLTGFPRIMAFVLGVSLTVITFYTAFNGLFLATIQRSIHLTLILSIIFLWFPASKKISPKKREELYEVIMNKALAVGVGIKDVDVIEKVNILNATKLAMKEAIENLKVRPEYVLIDGNQMIDIDIKAQTVVSGDAKSESIAAASIIAKVTRDRMLIEYDKKYPEYGFKNHKGYGTKANIEAIKKYGLTPIHRKSFCTKFVKEDK